MNVKIKINNEWQFQQNSVEAFYIGNAYKARHRGTNTIFGCVWKTIDLRTDVTKIQFFL